MRAGPGRIASLVSLLAACAGTPSQPAPHPLSLAFPSAGWAQTSPSTALGEPRPGPTAADAVAAAPMPPGAGAQAPPSAHGRPVDLDVRDADLRDVCRLLAEVGRVNIVVADGVGGPVTMRLRHVPWDEALEALVAAKGLVARREGSVVIVSAR